MRENTILAAALCALLGATAACGGAADRGPFDDVPLEDSAIVQGLDGPVHMARDRYGVWHVRGDSLGDVAFANGYVHARDRMWQLELFRRAAAGRLAELFGAVRPETIALDLESRVHRLRANAELVYEQMLSSGDATDQLLAGSLQRYADGVNQYREELLAGEHEPPVAYALLVPQSVFEPWSPVDSLTIGRFQAWNLSYTGYEIEATAALEQARAGGAVQLFGELFPIAPMDPVATVPGFLPAGAARAARTGTGAAAGTGTGVGTGARSPLPAVVLAGAARFLAPKGIAGGLRSRDRRDGSNNWVVGGGLTGSGALLANDPHLQLVSPSLLYFIHLSSADGIDVAGAGFPGVPGVVLGHNQHLAWGGTVVAHDVTDFYDERIAPCPGGERDCVSFRGNPVPIEQRVEEIVVGFQGQEVERRRVPIEVVPHHGPILPALGPDGQVVARRADRAISVRWTGHQPSRESRALLRLWQAQSVEEGLLAFEDFGIGAQNWVLADDQGNIGWTTHALVPWRSPGCFTFDPVSAPEGNAPYLVVPGDGSCEWEGFMPFGTLPHAFNPAAGFLASANADPIGLTHGGDLSHLPRVGGRPYYLAAVYDPGLRVGRITRRVGELAAAGPIGLEQMAALQADARVNDGARFAPHIVAAAGALAGELAAPGSHPDLAGFAASLSAERRAGLAAAAARLASWSFDSPAGTDSPTAAELVDSTATSIFTVWMVEFLPLAVGDEASLVGADASWGEYLATAALRALEGGAPELCDDRATAGTGESCALVALRALDAALTWLASADGFGTADMSSWRWGSLHRLTLAGLLPVPELNIPPADDPDPALRRGYPRHGSTFSVDVAPGGYEDLDFTFRHGPSMRHLVAFTADGPVTWLALPGGQSHDLLSPHFRDLMDRFWSQNLYFTLPWTTAEVRAAGEGRIQLLPGR